MQPGLPATVDLRTVHRIALVGSPAAGRAAARALVCSAATFHSPRHLTVAVLTADAGRGEWEWIKWLPHAHSAERSDAVGAVRLIGTSAEALADLLPSPTHVLLVVDCPESSYGPESETGGPGMTVLEVAAADRPKASGVLQLDATETDRCDAATAEALARRLLPLQPAAAPDAEPTAPAGLPELLGIDRIGAFDPATTWRSLRARDRLRVPVGVGGHPSTGSGETGVVHLDLKESAQQGMGPHGLVVGATGSGKSEFLRTLVLGLAISHPPDQLNLVLVDFKGGATFVGMADLPHVSAVITNLSGELALVDRMQDALAGEMVRRQEVLRSAGNVASVRDYEQLRERRADLPPLPSLLIVVDEFSELLAAKPELTELFVAIGRLGRSLGLHLLLASQRLEEGRLRGLDSHLSYRVGLRTFSAQESRTVLGVPDAYQLPPVPGLGYLKPDPTTLTRFQAAYVSGPASGHRPDATRRPRRSCCRIVRPCGAGRGIGAADSRGRPRAAEAPSVLDLAVARMRGRGPAAHRIWLPPLDQPDPLDRLMPAARGPLRIPVGTLDRPRDQRRDPLVLDLTGAGGHVAVVGGPRSGKSTLLRTILAATALAGSPRETQWFVLDLGSGALGPLAGPAPRGGASPAGPRATSYDASWRRCRTSPTAARPVAPTTATARSSCASTGGARCARSSTSSSRRCSSWPSAGWGWASTWWRPPRGGRTSGRRCATSSAPGSSCGWAIPSTRRWTARSPRQCRQIDRAAGSCPARCTSSPRCHPTAWSLRSVPRGRASRRRRCGCCPPASPSTTYDAGRGPDAGGILLGLDEARLAPVALDPSAEPHLLVFGDGRSGRTALLRTYLHEVVRTRTPAQAQLVLVDYRRSLLGEVPDHHLLHYLTSADLARAALDELAAYLRTRLPGPDATPDQLRRRSWWTRRGGVRRGRRLRPGRDAAGFAGGGAPAAARAGGRRRSPPRRRAAQRRRRPGAVRAGDPVAAGPGGAGRAPEREPGGGPAGRHRATDPGGAGSGAAGDA